MIVAKSYKYLIAFIIGALILPGVFFMMPTVNAQTETERLQAEIKERNARLSEIEKEIAGYEAELKKVGAEKSTLQSAINQLELERKKIQADITYTQNKIDNTDLEINKLSLEIDDTSESISKSAAAVGEILRVVDQNDQESLIELFLRHENLSEFWNEVAGLESVRTVMNDRVYELTVLKSSLEGKVGEETMKRGELMSLKNQYSGQQAVLDNNRKQKSELLTATKNEEAEYQKLLNDKKAAREKLVKEVQAIESELQFMLDPNSIPVKGSSVFQWPLEKVVLTQYFGYTKFALQNQGVYKNNMHNGIDLGAPTGTKIFAPLGGTVRATANTDLVPGCYSWGQWALVDHPNGLSTLYAHMSNTSVSAGQKLNTGDLIGFVGATGYATGPHLHFTVYVSAAVSVKSFNQFKAVTGCGAALSPFSAVEGYLNPMDYLPAS
ncbi:peptidoglycan DD-metalloendopeptidase family protein [Candidatus Nomurabacteria bacterium]|nr:peptidoglycan DD-metalloendopeptidase family protein [Candidatus Nomurabacteria bacterium]MCB9819201.1 peptidoglycan DD-metalloendopeptidase family protein [Candidatus Nomurabacteria bacterium]